MFGFWVFFLRNVVIKVELNHKNEGIIKSISTWISDEDITLPLVEELNQEYVFISSNNKPVNLEKIAMLIDEDLREISNYINDIIK